MPFDSPVEASLQAKRRRMRFSRSRFGCDACRHHKKKCDESRPVCGRCNMLRKVCAYSYPQAGRAADGIYTPSAQSTLSSPPVPSLTNLPLVPPVDMSTAETSTGPSEDAGAALAEYVDDSFLRAFSFSTDVAVPPWTPPDAQPPGSEFESFWNALVRSVGTDDPSSTDRTLIEYYRLVVSPTILGIEDGSNCASQFYKGVASTATEDDQAAMMHAVLAVSAQHLSNFARAFNNVDKAISFNEQAAHHRSEALYLLRVSGSGTEEGANENEALLPSVTLLLTLSALLKGDPDIIPAFLDQTQAYLDAIEHPSPAPHLPTISAIYSIYRVLQAVSSSEPLDLTQVFVVHEPSEAWVRVADETVERLVGIPREMLLLFARVNNLVLEWRSLNDTLARIEVRSQCSMIQHDLEDDSIWAARWAAPDLRIAAGLEFFRTALRVMIMRDVLGLPAAHPRVERCVDALLAAVPRIRTGTEIGLVWPWLIVAAEAQPARHEALLAFIRRCQWKGSAPPRIADAIVQEVWEARAAGRTMDWRTALVARGSPLVI
ncbi:hypothetical protein CcaverHIS002_0113480 [Cutaneotrichosporon cavernicola]|nr:hypothetical protein CcaverHIS002_0113480 [Cutaneotrichosporon cavernicola]BEI96390.1 hypothetical protein CcaverHIS631_0113390 [Cutaneotrichosporon cavernicola]BEJ04162.1 hypothetical protein CcaverHIS641_0113370 [Cutaneotrichosporon cavernicola]